MQRRSHRGVRGAEPLKYSPCRHISRIAIVLVNVDLLIKLKESPIFRRKIEQIHLSANWGCAPHQQFPLASPVGI